jgi:hypothetical protein
VLADLGFRHAKLSGKRTVRNEALSTTDQRVLVRRPGHVRSRTSDRPGHPGGSIRARDGYFAGFGGKLPNEIVERGQIDERMASRSLRSHRRTGRSKPGRSSVEIACGEHGQASPQPHRHDDIFASRTTSVSGFRRRLRRCQARASTPPQRVDLVRRRASGGTDGDPPLAYARATSRHLDPRCGRTRRGRCHHGSGLPRLDVRTEDLPPSRASGRC